MELDVHLQGLSQPPGPVLPQLSNSQQQSAWRCWPLGQAASWQVPHPLELQFPVEVLHVTERYCVPAQPQLWLAAGLLEDGQSLTGVLQADVSQPPHKQDEEHARVLLPVCPPSHAALSVAPGRQLPCPVQPPQLPAVHEPVLVSQLTLRVCIPQFPHSWLADGLLEAGQSLTHWLDELTLQAPQPPQLHPLQELHPPQLPQVSQLQLRLRVR